MKKSVTSAPGGASMGSKHGTTPNSLVSKSKAKAEIGSTKKAKSGGGKDTIKPNNESVGSKISKLHK